MMLLLAFVGGTRSPGGLEDARGHCFVRRRANGSAGMGTNRPGEFVLVDGIVII